MAKSLSILILTHNRPKLFDRCINAIIPHLNDDVEVIVNNDSNDIIEIEHPQITYHYNKFNNMSMIYEFLLNESVGEYIYFAEDDDYVTNSIFELRLDSDMIIGNYYPRYSPSWKLECMSHYKDDLMSPEDFADVIHLKHLQLSQFIFKRSTIIDFVFPMDNNIHNDINLVMHAASNSGRINTINRIMFHQTTDGGDNVSFPETTTEVVISKSLDFVEDYELFNTTT